MHDIIVFGKGWYFERKREQIENEYKIIAFIDNAADSYIDVNTEESDIPTYLPKELINLPKVPIIIMSIHFIEMWKQLMMEGVDENRIEFGMNYSPFFDATEEVLSQLNGKVVSKSGELFVACNNGSYKFADTMEYTKIMNGLIKDKHVINEILGLPLIPFSRRFGRERGTPVDRYYIEKFLESKSHLISGCVMEIGDNTYIKKYGEKVKESYVLHALGLGEEAIKGDLVTGEGIQEEMLDCFICTQTLQVIFDIESAIKNIYRSLKDNGTALITMHGISQLSISDYNRWGEYWRFTKKSVKLLFEKHFDEVEVHSYGNVKVATALLYGLCMEDLNESDYMFNDEYYQMLITVIGRKRKEKGSEWK
ncbi:MAG: class I SAM-dependent methyltransferase [Lachnospiraceae bacterium]|jgi:hypothetical protein|nr:class I SAM-dependent methyltransferase [Lachnospiraceae bacterium]